MPKNAPLFKAKKSPSLKKKIALSLHECWSLKSCCFCSRCPREKSARSINLQLCPRGLRIDGERVFLSLGVFEVFSINVIRDGRVAEYSNYIFFNTIFYG